MQRYLENEIFVAGSNDKNEKTSELQSGKNKDGEHVARSTTYTFPGEYKDEKTFKMEYKDKAPSTQMFYNITASYSWSDGTPNPWNVDNIKFLGPLFGKDDIIKRKIKGVFSDADVPGFIFKFDYYGYSDLYGEYDTDEKDQNNLPIKKNDWIRVQNCQM